MMNNPELRRNFWLELTPHRLVAMPALLLLIFICVFAFSERHYTPVAWTALGLFGLITIIWGSRLSADSVLDEFRDKTWDMQRMSAIGPWMLTWGKLIGANIFAWYGGVICLVAFSLNAIVGESDIPIWVLLLLSIGTALLAHGAGILSGILASRNTRRTRPFVNSIVLVFVLLSFAPRIQDLTEHQTMSWYGMEFDRLWFLSISIWIFAAWSVVGVYRLLCMEMQVRTTFVAWLSFCAFFSLYMAGFLLNGEFKHLPIFVFVAVGFIVSMTMTYLAVWLERRDAIAISRLVLQWKSAGVHRALQETPCWMSTAPVALCFALLLFFVTRDGPLANKLVLSFSSKEAWSLLPLKWWLFGMRDIALLHFFSMSRTPGRAGLTTMVYLGVIYWLIPQLLSASGLDAVMVLFTAWSGSHPVTELVGVLMQTIFVVWLAFNRWHARTVEINQRSSAVDATTAG